MHVWAVTCTSYNGHGADDVDEALIGACCGGHMHLVEWAMERGATDFDGALFNACKGGHKTLAKWAVEHGAKFDFALFGACSGNHIGLAEWAVKHGATDFDIAWSHAWTHHNRKLLAWVRAQQKKKKWRCW